jgi:VacB/RNase II family 3'-5' exoribonuclease
MAASVLRVPAGAEPFADAFERIRTEFAVPRAFPRAVEAEADEAASRGPVTPPGSSTGGRRDARDIAFVTIDPPGSRDLDQAFHAEDRGGGFRVHYAIADVAAFVAPGGAMDTESWARGVTLYLPDRRAPMLPDGVGKGCASLLPDEERPALLWTIELDDAGNTTAARLERATVRSRAALSYEAVQAALDAQRADESLSLLRDVGRLRLTLEASRGGVSLDLPSQEVVVSGEDGFELVYRAPLPVEQWNAQVSLLAGMEAAKIMVDEKLGILRTLPPPRQQDVERLRRTAAALDVLWPDAARWPDVVRALDRNNSRDAAFLIQAAHLLRGAGYTKLDAANTIDPTAVPRHAGLAAAYAHVTAPLRRLADRYANEIVLAHCAGVEPPDWASVALDRLVTTMETATQRDAAIERATIDAVECAVLAAHVGHRFDAVVVDANERGVIVQLRQPAVIAPLDADVALGDRVTVVLSAVDPVARRVELALAASARR